MADGAVILESLISSIKPADDHALPGEKCYRGRPVELQTLFGPVKVTRNCYYNACKPMGTNSRYPLDKSLGLFGCYTPGLAKIATRLAARNCYQAASDDLALTANVLISQRQLQRLCQDVGANLRETLKRLPHPEAVPVPVLYVELDGTGMPMKPVELKNVKGKGPDGKAQTREVKVGCVFTQTTTSEKGKAIRDEESTTWIGNFKPATEFGISLRDEANRRGCAKAKRVVVLGDGAVWIWELAKNFFPEATCILDFWHAAEHLSETAKMLVGAGEKFDKLYKSWREKLANSELTEIVKEVQTLQAAHGSADVRESVQKNLNYLENNRARLDYKRYRAEGLFIGSGVVESGCKKFIGSRFKEPGMFWTEPGARNLLDIRAALLSQDRLAAFWDARAS